MYPYHKRHSLFHKAIAVVVVCLFLVNDLAFAAQSSTLAPELRLKPFIAKHLGEFKDVVAISEIACGLRNLIRERKVREGDVARLNNKLQKHEVSIEDFIDNGGVLPSGKKYALATFNFKKDGKKIQALFFKDNFPSSDLTADDRRELVKFGIKTDKDSSHLDFPGLEGVWFVNPGEKGLTPTRPPKLEERRREGSGSSLASEATQALAAPGRPIDLNSASINDAVSASDKRVFFIRTLVTLFDIYSGFESHLHRLNGILEKEGIDTIISPGTLDEIIAIVSNELDGGIHEYGDRDIDQFLLPLYNTATDAFEAVLRRLSGVVMKLPPEKRDEGLFELIYSMQKCAYYSTKLIEYAYGFSRLGAIRKVDDVGALPYFQKLNDMAKTLNIEISRKGRTDRVSLSGTNSDALYFILNEAFKNAAQKGCSRILYSIEDDEEAAVITVADNIVSESGLPAFSAENAQKLFSPGYTTKDTANAGVKGGFGLGLSKVLLFVEFLGGRLVIESRAQEGSKFVLMIPKDGRPLKGPVLTINGEEVRLPGMASVETGKNANSDVPPGNASPAPTPDAAAAKPAEPVEDAGERAIWDAIGILYDGSRWQGVGIIVRGRYFVTPAHVAGDDPVVVGARRRVRMTDGRIINAGLLAIDRDIDLAIFELEGDGNFVSASFDNEQLTVFSSIEGDLFVPWRRRDNIEMKKMHITIELSGKFRRRLLLTSTQSIYHGMSGSPVLANGKVIGMFAEGVATIDPVGPHYAWAIPAHAIDKFINETLSLPKSTPTPNSFAGKPWGGVGIATLQAHIRNGRMSAAKIAGLALKDIEEGLMTPGDFTYSLLMAFPDGSEHNGRCKQVLDIINGMPLELFGDENTPGPMPGEMEELTNQAIAALVEDHECRDAVIFSRYGGFMEKYGSRYPLVCRRFGFYYNKFRIEGKRPESGMEMVWYRAMYAQPWRNFTRGIITILDECLPLWNRCLQLAKTDKKVDEELYAVKDRLNTPSITAVEDPTLIRETAEACRQILARHDAVKSAEPATVQNVHDNKLAERVQGLTGKEIVETDALLSKQIVEALLKGDVVSVSFKNLDSGTDKYNDTRMALIGIGVAMQRTFPRSAFTDILSLRIPEILKNAFVHGNRLNFKSPIYLHLRLDGDLKVLEVFDVASSDAASDAEMAAAYSAELFGFGVGEQQWLSAAPYKRQTIKDEDGNTVGTVASLALNLGGWDNPLAKYPDVLTVSDKGAASGSAKPAGGAADGPSGGAYRAMISPNIPALKDSPDPFKAPAIDPGVRSARFNVGSSVGTGERESDPNSVTPALGQTPPHVWELGERDFAGQDGEPLRVEAGRRIIVRIHPNGIRQGGTVHAGKSLGRGYSWHEIYDVELVRKESGYLEAELMPGTNSITFHWKSDGVDQWEDRNYFVKIIDPELLECERLVESLREKKPDVPFDVLEGLIRMHRMFLAYKEMLSDYGSDTRARVKKLLEAIERGDKDTPIMSEAGELIALMPDPHDIDIEKNGEKNWYRWFDDRDSYESGRISEGCLMPCLHCIRNNNIPSSKNAPLPKAVRELSGRHLIWYRNNSCDWRDPFFGVSLDGIKRFSAGKNSDSSNMITIKGWPESDLRIQRAMERIARLYRDKFIDDKGFGLSFHLAWPDLNVIDALIDLASGRDAGPLEYAYAVRYANAIRTLGPALNDICVYKTDESRPYDEMTVRVFIKAMELAGIRDEGLAEYIRNRHGSDTPDNQKPYMVSSGGQNIAVYVSKILPAGKGGRFIAAVKAAGRGERAHLAGDLSYNDPYIISSGSIFFYHDEDDSKLGLRDYPQPMISGTGEVTVFSVKDHGKIIMESTLDELDPIREREGSGLDTEADKGREGIKKGGEGSAANGRSGGAYRAGPMLPGVEKSLGANPDPTSNVMVYDPTLVSPSARFAKNSSGGTAPNHSPLRGSGTGQSPGVPSCGIKTAVLNGKPGDIQLVISAIEKLAEDGFIFNAILDGDRLDIGILPLMVGDERSHHRDIEHPTDRFWRVAVEPNKDITFMISPYAIGPGKQRETADNWIRLMRLLGSIPLLQNRHIEPIYTNVYIGMERIEEEDTGISKPSHPSESMTVGEFARLSLFSEIPAPIQAESAGTHEPANPRTNEKQEGSDPNSVRQALGQTPPADLGQTPSKNAFDEAVRIHEENREYTPDVAEKTILCHVIADSIVPAGQRGTLSRLDIAARDKDYDHEKFVELRVDSSKDFAQQVSDAIEEAKRIYEEVYGDDYKNYRFEFDVACPSKDDVVSVQNKLGLPALAFSRGEGDVAQIEGIMMAMRALYSKDVNKLKAAYKFLGGTEPVDGINNVEEFARRIAFTLPPAKSLSDWEKERLKRLVERSALEAA